MLAILPEFNQVVTASRDEAFDIIWLLSRRLIDQAARNHRRTPTHCVTADLQGPPEYQTPLNKGSDKPPRRWAPLTVCALLIFFTSHC